MSGGILSGIWIFVSFANQNQRNMENKTLFSEILERQSDLLERIRHAAHEAHAAVNQFYGVDLPYSYHLDGVAELVARYGGEVCTRAEDVPAVMFGAWFHDSIEDARLTYNDVRKRARSLGLDEAQAFTAAEIVYALTNEKGRTRAERAGVKYYEGIRATPYAPMVKLADRIANVRFSLRQASDYNHRMARVYREEWPHFLASLWPATDDPRMGLPQEMVLQLCELLGVDGKGMFED